MSRLSDLNRREEKKSQTPHESRIPLAIAAFVLVLLLIAFIGISAGGVYFVKIATTTTTSTTTTTTTSTSTSSTTTTTQKPTTTTATTTSTTLRRITSTTLACGQYLQEPCVRNGTRMCDPGFTLNSEKKCAPMYCSTTHANSGKDAACGGWVFSQTNCEDPQGAARKPA